VAQVIDCLEVRHLTRPQLVRQCELGTSLEPLRKVIPLRVVRDTFCRHGRELLFDFAEVARAAHFTSVRHAEHEIAEAKLLHHEPPQLLQQCRRSFQQKRRARLAREREVLGMARLQHHGDIRLPCADAPRELQPGIAREHAIARELYVGDHAQNVLFVIGEIAPRFLE
jgi:hypothetical protein